MALERFCRRTPVTTQPDASVGDAAQMMREHHVGAVVVVEDGVPVGMITDRDIVLRTVLSGLDASATKVRDVMSESVVSARIDEQIDDVVTRMRAGRVRRLPIVDRNGRLAGIVTLDDVMVLLAGELGEAVAAVRSNRGP